MHPFVKKTYVDRMLLSVGILLFFFGFSPTLSAETVTNADGNPCFNLTIKPFLSEAGTRQIEVNIGDVEKDFLSEYGSVTKDMNIQLVGTRPDGTKETHELTIPRGGHNVVIPANARFYSILVKSPEGSNRPEIGGLIAEMQTDGKFTHVYDPFTPEYVADVIKGDTPPPVRELADITSHDTGKKIVLGAVPIPTGKPSQDKAAAYTLSELTDLHERKATGGKLTDDETDALVGVLSDPDKYGALLDELGRRQELRQGEDTGEPSTPEVWDTSPLDPEIADTIPAEPDRGEGELPGLSRGEGRGETSTPRGGRDRTTTRKPEVAGLPVGTDVTAGATQAGRTAVRQAGETSKTSGGDAIPTPTGKPGTPPKPDSTPPSGNPAYDSTAGESEGRGVIIDTTLFDILFPSDDKKKDKAAVKTELKWMYIDGRFQWIEVPVKEEKDKKKAAPVKPQGVSVIPFRTPSSDSDEVIVIPNSKDRVGFRAVGAVQWGQAEAANTIKMNTMIPNLTFVPTLGEACIQAAIPGQKECVVE